MPPTYWLDSLCTAQGWKGLCAVQAPTPVAVSGFTVVFYTQQFRPSSERLCQTPRWLCQGNVTFCKDSFILSRRSGRQNTNPAPVERDSILELSAEFNSLCKVFKIQQ